MIDLDAACGEMVKEANEHGGEDNITLIIAKLREVNFPNRPKTKLKWKLIDLGNIHDTDDQDTAEIV